MLDDWNDSFLAVLARLKPGVCGAAQQGLMLTTRGCWSSRRRRSNYAQVERREGIPRQEDCAGSGSRGEDGRGTQVGAEVLFCDGGSSFVIACRTWRICCWKAGRGQREFAIRWPWARLRGG